MRSARKLLRGGDLGNGLRARNSCVGGHQGGRPECRRSDQRFDMGIGHLLMMNQAGFMSAERTRRSLELFAREVYPAVRGLGE